MVSPRDGWSMARDYEGTRERTLLSVKRGCVLQVTFRIRLVSGFAGARSHGTFCDAYHGKFAKN
jgi:hypothetical protein